VNGYHFWYKYYRDEHYHVKGSIQDLITVLSNQGWDGDTTPDFVTLSFEWKPFSRLAKQQIPLVKPQGCFWVGPSPEGLMAIGTVRFLQAANPPKLADINGVRYKLKLFRSWDGNHLRSFYPKFMAMLPPSQHRAAPP
jgi:poly(U)-specific endoribonuclease